MKKLFLSIVFASSLGFAQTTYQQVMKTNIEKLEKAKTPEDLQSLKDSFHRISEKEKTWQSYYYAGLAAARKGRFLMRKGETNDLEFYGDLTLEYASKADELNPKNSEIQVLFKMAYSLKMMVNPAQYYMTFGKKAEEYLDLAEKLNPENPRVTLLKAEDTYFTPKQFGGSKEKGILLFEKALHQFEKFKPDNDLDPNWGEAEATYFVSLKNQ